MKVREHFKLDGAGEDEEETGKTSDTKAASGVKNASEAKTDAVAAVEGE
jgi:hypothetical protein